MLASDMPNVACLVSLVLIVDINLYSFYKFITVLVCSLFIVKLDTESNH